MSGTLPVRLFCVQAHIRDRNERQKLIERQLDQRQALQIKINNLREKQEKELQKLTADMAQMAAQSTAPDPATPKALRRPGKGSPRSSRGPPHLGQKG